MLPRPQNTTSVTKGERLVEAHQGCRSNVPPALPGSEIWRRGHRHQVWRGFAPRNQVTDYSSHLLLLSPTRRSSAASPLALARQRPLAVPRRLVGGPRRGGGDLFPRTPLSSR